MIDKVIPYGRQCITDEDVQAVVETLRSDYLTQGPKITEFEYAFARFSVIGILIKCQCPNYHQMVLLAHWHTGKFCALFNMPLRILLRSVYHFRKTYGGLSPDISGS